MRLKKASPDKLNEEVLQYFLRMYRLTFNPNTPSVMSTVELIFARTVKSVLLPSRKLLTVNKGGTNTTKVSDKVFFIAYKDGKGTEEDGMVAVKTGKFGERGKISK